jgi:hypothetical protein
MDIGRDHVKRRFYNYVRSFGFQEYWVARNLKKPFNSRPALFDRVTDHVLVPAPIALPAVASPRPAGAPVQRLQSNSPERGLTPERIRAVERWRASGMTKAAFAGDLGVPVSTFKRWVYWCTHNPGFMAPIEGADPILTREPVEEIEIPAVEDEAEPEPEEEIQETLPLPEPVAVAPPPTPAPVPQPSRGFVVEAPGGFKVDIPAGFDAEELRRLLRVLT